MEVFEGNPIGKWVWANVWSLPLFRRGEPGQSPCLFGDSAHIFRTNIEQVSLLYLLCLLVQGSGGLRLVRINPSWRDALHAFTRTPLRWH